MKFIFLILPVIFVTDLCGQVNLQNGSANYDIPIFSFSDPKSGLGTGVSLSYSSGNGLVVSNRASNTGQNWSLIAGGAIFRKQNGEPDDQNSTGAFPLMPPYNWRGFNQEIAVYDNDYQSVPWTGDPYSRYYIDNYYPNGFMYSEFPVDMVDNYPLQYAAPKELALMARFKSNMDKKWAMSRRALTDRQQDIFIFNCNNISGEFVIGKDGNPVLINDSKIVVDKTTADHTGQNIRTRISEFTIKDANGVIYKFSAYELSEIMKFVEISNEGTSSFKKYISSGEPTGKYTIQKWLLTEIINPLTQEKILFEYDNYDLDIITDITPSYQFTEGQTSESVQVYKQRAKGQLKRLKDILLPDGHKIQFTYSTTLPYRPDVPDDIPLTQVKILYNNEEINSFNLTYGYFLRKDVKNLTDPITEADKRFARLCLSSVQKTGTNISEPSYKFNYYTGNESSDPKDIVPPFDCVAQDHWGYYNKSSIVNNDDPNPAKEVLKDLMLNNATYRQPSPEAAKLGLLKSVENPFGGKLTFEYEQNDSKDSDPPYLTKTTGGVRVFKTTVSDGISSVNDIVTNYNYKLADGSTSGWGYETPTYLNQRQIKIWNASQNEGYTKDGALKYNLATTLSKIAANKVAGFAYNAAVKASFKAAKTAAQEIFNKTCEVVKVYPMPEPLSLFASYVIGKMIDGLFVLFNPTDYIWSDSYSFLPFQAQNPIGINYSRVEVLNTSVPGGVGKVINEFTAPVNVRSEIPAFTMPYSQKQRFANWKYGLPSKILVYNQAGILQKEQLNTYNIIINPIINDFNKSCKVEVVRPESVWCWVGAQSSAMPFSDFSWEYYYPITGRAELGSTTEKNYSPAGIMSQNDITNTYNNDYLKKTTTTTKSNGDIITVKNYYTDDYNNISTAIPEMKNRNMLDAPISTETWLTKPNGDQFLLDATVNEFTKLGDGEIKIKKIYKLVTKQPLIQSFIGEQNRDMLVRNNTYFKEQLNFNYDDNNGILLETTTPESRVSSKIFDYNYRIVTAEITNAAQSEVAYTSFEADQKGSWQYDLANIQSNDGVTGKKYFHFPANQLSVTRTVTGTKTYILSLWNRGTGFTVLKDASALTASKTVTNPVTGWIYNEYTFTAPGNIAINNSAALDLDELRLYPKDARMATVAYDPKVGKVTECDVNNKLLYYEYDGLNRLQYVKDDRKNILKKICYNYAGEPENCLDLTDNSPQWRANGLTRCQPCPTNYNFNSGAKEYQEEDLNPQSPTYGTYRWTVDPTGSCPTPPFWVVTNTYCQQNGYPPWGNTGWQVTVETDLNPCSPTYNQTQQTSIYNPQACPPPIGCDPPCTAPQYKCINGQCVLGTWQVVRVVKLGKFGPWECTYAYCFPDGTTSTYMQTITSTTACVVTCF